MATKKEEDEDFAKQADQLREDLSNAYAFVDGQKYTQQAATFTIEEATDQFIEATEGKPLFRPNELERLANIKSKVESAIMKTKAISPETFVKANENNVNTPK